MGLAHDGMQWISSGSTRRWRAEGISVKKPRLERWMEQYFNQKVAELTEYHRVSQHAYVTEDNIKEYVSNSYVRRVVAPTNNKGGGDETDTKTVWQVSGMGLNEFKELVTEEQAKEKNDRNWVSWAYFFKEENISWTQDAIEREIRRFGEYKSRQFVMDGGMTPDDAKREVEENWVRLGKNRQRKIVWQVRKDKVDEYMNWHREEERWINPTMWVRCRGVGICHDFKGIEHVLPDLFRREVSYLTQEGMEEEKAKYEVEKRKCRIGVNTHNDTSWQFHADYAPLLAKRMEFLSPSLLVAAIRNFHHYSDPETGDEWIEGLREKPRRERYEQIRQILENVHPGDGEFFGREKIAQAIEDIYTQELQTRLDGGMSPSAAARDVEENIAVHGYNYRGALSWQFDSSVLTKVLERLEEREKEKNAWCSASPTMLETRNIGEGQDIVNLALAYLHHQEIEDRVSRGMAPDEAQADVENNLIRLGLPRGSNVPVWQYHENFEPALKLFLRAPRDWVLKAFEIEERAGREALSLETDVSLESGAAEALRKKWKERVANKNNNKQPGQRKGGDPEAVKPSWVLRTGAELLSMTGRSNRTQAEFPGVGG